jgi:hypothetical protein
LDVAVAVAVWFRVATVEVFVGATVDVFVDVPVEVLGAVAAIGLESESGIVLFF